MKKRLAKKIWDGKSLLSYNPHNSVRAANKLFPNRLVSIPFPKPKNRAHRIFRELFYQNEASFAFNRIRKYGINSTPPL